MADTEAEAIAELATDAAGTQDVIAVPGEAGKLIVPPDFQIRDYDSEYLLEAPRRARGKVALYDAASLVLYVRKHGDNTAPVDRTIAGVIRAGYAETTPTALYADVDTITVTGVINGHGHGHVPGWGDHRATLKLRHAPEWSHWAANDRTWLTQTEFAEHLEEGYGEIVEPSATEMLELAQTLQAHTKLQFRSQQLLGSGQRQFTYHEEIDARAGETGTIVIPSKFKLGLICFEGQTEGYRVDARFQFRLTEGALKVRYLLTRPHDVIRSAFDDVVSEVEHGVGLVAFRGTPPA